jgi:hypothetical protein
MEQPIMTESEIDKFFSTSEDKEALLKEEAKARNSPEGLRDLFAFFYEGDIPMPGDIVTIKHPLEKVPLNIPEDSEAASLHMIVIRTFMADDGEIQVATVSWTYRESHPSPMPFMEEKPAANKVCVAYGTLPARWFRIVEKASPESLRLIKGAPESRILNLK